MFDAWKLNRIAWSLRKVFLPIGPSDLVLDVGSGSSPHPAADVVLERYLDSKHRFGDLVIDRPTVLADACKMPFRDKAFDFVIAFHVLEHVADPTSFLQELQRVGKAGYIETPNAIFERLVPYNIHLLEIMNINNTLLINKKVSARPDNFLNELELIKHSAKWNRIFYGNPEMFHVCHFWEDKINFKVVNPDVSSEWFVDPGMPELNEQSFVQTNGGKGIRSRGLAALRKWHKLRKNKVIDLAQLLACPGCHGALSISNEFAACQQCQMSYSLSPVPDFNTPLTLQRLNNAVQRSA
ncbi:MAG TPA: class I SAM-dependent methyltransferase [Pyrinomonadaceae bacterium]|nr:class I SAM-dependent methyltransferase [Pyrinomonadaceae bacterium]